MFYQRRLDFNSHHSAHQKFWLPKYSKRILQKKKTQNTQNIIIQYNKDILYCAQWSTVKSNLGRKKMKIAQPYICGRKPDSFTITITYIVHNRQQFESITTNNARESFNVDICLRRSKDRTVMNRVTDGNDVNAPSACSHCLNPGRRRVVRVPVRHNHQVVGYVRSVSVYSLKHHVCREPVKCTHPQYVFRQVLYLISVVNL